MWNSDQVRARRLPKKALPPYCEQRFRGTAQGPRQAEPRVPEAHSNAPTFALRRCAASGRARNPTPCGLPELFLQHGGALSCPGIQPLIRAWPSPRWRQLCSEPHSEIPGGWGTRAACDSGSTPRAQGTRGVARLAQRLSALPAPPRSGAKKFEAGGERSFGVGGSPVLHLSLCRGAEPERNCFPPPAARGTDWVGTPLLPRAPSRRWRCLRGSVRETRGAHLRPGQGRQQLWVHPARAGFCGTWALFSQTRRAPPPPTLLETRRLCDLGVQAGDRATGQVATGFFVPEYARRTQFQFWEFYATGLSTNPKG